MGQYFTPVIIRTGNVQAFNSWDYNNGLKLMEHAYLGNTFTEVVVKQLLNNKANLAWVGDYADNENDRQLPFLAWLPSDYAPKLEIGEMENSWGLFFINHTKKEYFSMSVYINQSQLVYGYSMIHPLPLLTALGNGRGGGDYKGDCMDMVGVWACDEIEAKSWFEDKTYKDITPLLKFGKRD